MKDINIFSKALAAKGVFRIISTEDLWQEVMRKKYIAPGITGELIRKPSKQGKGGSIAWKALMTEYHLIGDYLAWLIGNGQRVRLGADPWIGCSHTNRLSQNLIHHLHTRNCQYFADVYDRDQHVLWDTK